ncbi:hypothetical protein EON63_14125 [archaeon]|nr:MAG: hypothetical protein EON63_14125 [archaeon]
MTCDISIHTKTHSYTYTYAHLHTHNHYPVVFTAPLPYVAFMIVDFHMAPDVNTAGYEAGWITGMFMVGRFVAGESD